MTGPAALAAAIPYLVPVPPTGSLVMVPMGADGRVGALYSRQLPAMPRQASTELLRHWAGDIGRDLAAGVALLGLRPDEELAVAVLLPPELEVPPPWFGEIVLGGLVSLPELLDAIAVFGDSWRSLLCRDEGCCPAGGSRTLDNSDAALVAAQLVAAGFSPHRPDTGPVGRALAGLAPPLSVSARRRLLRRVWPLVQLPPAQLAPQQVARLLLAAERPGVRDALLTRLARAGRRDGGLWQRQAELWGEVAEQAPLDHAAGAHTICAVARWCAGQPQAALEALDHALRIQHGHRMASLLRSLIGSGAGPSDWLGKLVEMRESDCLAFDRPTEAYRSGRRAG